MNDYNIPYNYINNMSYMNTNTNSTAEAIDSYKGLIRGNLFDSLYDPYKNYKSMELKPTSERERLLLNVQKFWFAMIDLNLYLDVNPNDTEAIKIFNNYRTMHENAVNQFEQQYGPLTIASNYLNMTPWVWDNSPWPWEVQG